MAIKGLKGVYKFGEFSLDVATKELRGIDGSRTLRGRLFDLLLMLVRCAQRVVSSSEIVDAVWHDKEDASNPENLLHNGISELRRMLGDESPPGHKYIKNIRGEGYRLIPDVIEENVPTVVAVIPLKAKDGFTSTGEFVGGTLRSVGEVVVIPTEEVRKRLRTCHKALSLGHQLAADYVFRWEIEPVGSRLVIRNTSMDVRAGQRFGEYIPDRTDALLTDIEEKIAPLAARDLKRALNLRDQKRRKSPSTRNAQAHSLYWRGRILRDEFKEDILRRSAECFVRASRLDHTYAKALAGAADAYFWMGVFGFKPAETFRIASGYTTDALDRDPSLPEARTTSGLIAVAHQWNWEKAMREFQQVISKKKYATAYLGYAYLLTIHSDFTGAMEKIEEAMCAVEDVPPIIELARGIILYQAGSYRDALQSLLEFAKTHENSDPAFYWMACCHDQLGQYEDSVANAERAYKLSYGNPLNLMVEARAYALLGDQNKVRALMESLTDIEKERYVSAFHKAVIEVALGNHDQAFELLDRGYEERDFWMVTAATDGRLRNLRSDTRFEKLLDRLGLPRPE